MTIRCVFTSSFLLSFALADTIPGEGKFNYATDDEVKAKEVKINTAFAAERMLLINRLVDGKKRPIATGSLISTQGHFVSIRHAFANCTSDEKTERMNEPRECKDLVATYQGKDYSISIVSRKPVPEIKTQDEMFASNFTMIGKIAATTKAFEIRKPSEPLDIPHGVAVLPPKTSFMGAGLDHAGGPHLTLGTLALSSKDQGVFMVGYPSNTWEILSKNGIDPDKHKYQVPITFLGGPALSREGKLAGVMISLMDVSYTDLTDNHLTGKFPTGVFNSRNTIIREFLESDANGIFSVEGELHRLKSK